MTLKEFLEKYVRNTQMISVTEVKDDGVRFNTIHWVYPDYVLEGNAYDSTLADREVVEIFCGRGEVLYINVKGEQTMPTYVIRGERGSGKTVTMIQLSCEKQIPILVANQFAADALVTTAKRLGYNNLPKPFTVHDIHYRNALVGRRDILVDDADRVFNKLLNGVNIHTATYTPSFYEYELEDGPMNTLWLKSNPMLKWLTGDFEKENKK